VILFGASRDHVPAAFEADVAVLLVAIAASVLMISDVPYPKVSDALRVPVTLAATGFGLVAFLAYLLLANRATVESIVFTLLFLGIVAYIFGGPLYVRRARSAGEVLPVQ
jgi:phosphatidylserine synthase